MLSHNLIMPRAREVASKALLIAPIVFGARQIYEYFSGSETFDVEDELLTDNVRRQLGHYSPSTVSDSAVSLLN